MPCVVVIVIVVAVDLVVVLLVVVVVLVVALLVVVVLLVVVFVVVLVVVVLVSVSSVPAAAAPAGPAAGAGGSPPGPAPSPSSVSWTFLLVWHLLLLLHPGHHFVRSVLYRLLQAHVRGSLVRLTCAGVVGLGVGLPGTRIVVSVCVPVGVSSGAWTAGAGFGPGEAVVVAVVFGVPGLAA